MKNALKIITSVGLLSICCYDDGAVASTKKSKSVSTTAIRTLSSAAVADCFLKAGLPLQNIISYSAATDPNHLLGRPGYYTSKTNFRDSRHDSDNADGDDNTIEVFSTAQAALQRKQYVDRVTKGIPFLAQYQILRGRILVRLDRVMLPEEVQEYEAALNTIG